MKIGEMYAFLFPFVKCQNALRYLLFTVEYVLTQSFGLQRTGKETGAERRYHGNARRRSNAKDFDASYPFLHQQQ